MFACFAFAHQIKAVRADSNYRSPEDISMDSVEMLQVHHRGRVCPPQSNLPLDGAVDTSQHMKPYQKKHKKKKKSTPVPFRSRGGVQLEPIRELDNTPRFEIDEESASNLS